MMGMTVRSNIKDFTRHLNSIQKKQVPFATAQALNDTVFDVRKRIVERTYSRAFDVKNRRFASQAFRVVKATKRKQWARLYDRLGRGNLALHAKGGTKRAKGRHVAVPSSNVKRTASGKVSKAKRPRAVIASGKAFKGKTRGGKPVIFAKPRGKRGQVKLLYTLVGSVPVKKQFNFYDVATSTARRAFRHHFSKRLARALATAR